MSVAGREERPLRSWSRGLALLVLGTLALVALLAGWISGGHSEAVQLSLAQRDGAPLGAWWVLATRTVLGIVIAATAIAAALGTLLGAASLYVGSGGGLLARLVELSGSVPALVVVGVCRLWDPSGGVVALLGTFAVLRALEVAQLVRAQVLRTMPSDFVEASRALGATRRWQLRAHVVPRLSRPLVVNLLDGAASLVGLEAALTFVGLGLPGEIASWGGGLAVLASGDHPFGLACVVATIGLASAAFYGLGASLAAVEPPCSGPRALASEVSHVK